jgi:hypothetical protein
VAAAPREQQCEATALRETPGEPIRDLNDALLLSSIVRDSLIARDYFNCRVLVGVPWMTGSFEMKMQ